MKLFIDKYYRLFCSKYAEDICRFINHYDFAKQTNRERCTLIIIMSAILFQA